MPAPDPFWRACPPARKAENRTLAGDNLVLRVFEAGFWWGELRCCAPKARRVTNVRTNMCVCPLCGSCGGGAAEPNATRKSRTRAGIGSHLEA
eukprot:4209810-Pleurochrysis_carterae.AAC.2